MDSFSICIGMLIAFCLFASVLVLRAPSRLSIRIIPEQKAPAYTKPVILDAVFEECAPHNAPSLVLARVPHGIVCRDLSLTQARRLSIRA